MDKKLVCIDRRWWLSGLSRQQYSLKLAAEDPGLNPTRSKCLYVTIMDPVYTLPTEYGIDCSELEITFHYSNSRAPGDIKLILTHVSCYPITVHSGSNKLMKSGLTCTYIKGMSRCHIRRCSGCWSLL